MKHINVLAGFLLLTALTEFAHAAGPEIHSCEFEVKARCASGTASVTLADGVVTRVEVDADWCGQQGSPGYTCTIDSSRGDKDSKWSEDGSATLIDSLSPFNPGQPDRVKVTVGRTVSIDLEKAQSLGRCGAGAELPKAIVIPAQGKVCRVWLATP